MLRQFREIKNFALAASDGEIGKARELYFDDESWIVRYLFGRSELSIPNNFGRGQFSERSRTRARDVNLLKFLR